MPIEITVPLGVVVAREKIDRPWQEFRWRTVGVYLDAPDKADWRELGRAKAMSQFHAATVPLVLQRRETMSYHVNLANGEPSVYVVLREEGDPHAMRPVSVHVVTASPFEARAHSDMGFATVDRVVMPKRLVTMVEAFVDENNIVQGFETGQRQQGIDIDARTSAREPLFVMRERLEPHVATQMAAKTVHEDKA